VPDEDGGLQRAERAAEVLLGLAVAIAGRGVEVVDAQLHRARHRALALGHAAPDQQAADVAAAKAERGHPQARASE